MSVSSALHGGLIFPRRVRVLARHVSSLLPEAGRVIDIGCGSGELAWLLQQAGPERNLLGVDVLVRGDAHIAVEAFDGRTLPYADSTFDVAILVDVLHHSEDPESLLAEASRVAPVVVVKDHLADALLSRTRLRLMDAIGNTRYGVHLPYNYWTSAQWREAFRRLSLSVETWTDRLGLYPPPASWVFDASLHFVARLFRSRTHPMAVHGDFSERPPGKVRYPRSQTS